ncbi:MAG: hypothetical protein R3F60_12455 [bacterium]
MIALVEAGGIAVILLMVAWVIHRGRVPPATQRILADAAQRLGLRLDTEGGRCQVLGSRRGHDVLIHRVLDGWAITVLGVEGRDPPPPPAQLGGGRLQIPATVTRAEALAAEVDRALDLADRARPPVGEPLPRL